MPQDPASQGWHLDRRIPITLLAAILLQAMALAWAASAAFAQIGDNERRIEALEASRSVDRAVQGQISERLARIEERSAQQTALLADIKAALDRYVYGRHPSSDPQSPRWSTPPQDDSR